MIILEILLQLSLDLLVQFTLKFGDASNYEQHPVFIQNLSKVKENWEIASNCCDLEIMNFMNGRCFETNINSSE